MRLFLKIVSSALLLGFIAFSILLFCKNCDCEKFIITLIFGGFSLACIVCDVVLELKSFSLSKNEKLNLLKKITFGIEPTDKQNKTDDENQCQIVIKKDNEDIFKTFCNTLIEI